ncbi:MAG: ATP-binding protein [Spirochaetales bacterium]|nr:ATP-binding protein [Spirochaetales bacterium]
MKRLLNFFKSAAFRVVVSLAFVSIITGVVSFFFIDSSIHTHFQELSDRKDREMASHIAEELQYYVEAYGKELNYDAGLIFQKYLSEKHFLRRMKYRNTAMKNPRPMQPPKGPDIIITDSSNQVIFSTISEKLFDIDHSKSEKVIFDSKTFYLVYTFSILSPETSKDTQEIIKKAEKSIRNAVFLSVLIALIPALILLVSMYLPLKKLKKTTDALVAGDYGVTSNLLIRDEFYQLEESINKLSLKLQKSEQQRKQMISDTAHELRTPAAMIKSRLELLEEGIYSFDTNNLEFLRRDTERLISLINNLFFLSECDSNILAVKKSAHNLQEILTTLIAHFQPEADSRGIALSLEAENYLVRTTIDLDIELFNICMNNIISNALRYAHNSVKIILSSENEAVCIKIIDDGNGVHSQDLPRIFDRYYRADTSRSSQTGGNGLGLSIAKTICTLHGWQISAHNILNSAQSPNSEESQLCAREANKQSNQFSQSVIESTVHSNLSGKSTTNSESSDNPAVHTNSGFCILIEFV